MATQRRTPTPRSSAGAKGRASGSARQAAPRQAAPRQAAPRHGGAPSSDRPWSSLGGRRPQRTRTSSGKLAVPVAKSRPQLPSVDRRTLFKGAAGLGALGVAASALSSLQGCSNTQDQAQEGAPTVVDDANAVSVTDTYTYQDTPPSLQESGSWTLPLGTVLYPAEGTWLPALATGESANPMVTGGAFSCADGSLATVVAKPQTSGANYVIYEVRCSDSVYAWVELDVVSNDWVLYAAPFAGGALTGTAVTLFSAGEGWDIPSLAVSGDKVVWLVMPTAGGEHATEDSACYLWKKGQSQAAAVVTSHGRFACEPTISEGVVTLVPRVHTDEGMYYGITGYTLADDLATQTGQLVLPQSVRPFSAVTMGGRFVFQIEANYSSGGLLGKMGTYVAMGNDTFVTLSREPAAPVAGHGDVLIVKTRASYLVFDLASKTYGTLVAANRSVDYGEYPARVGECSTFVTFATVKDAQTTYPVSVQVRAYGFGAAASQDASAQ